MGKTISTILALKDNMSDKLKGIRTEFKNLDTASKKNVNSMKKSYSLRPDPISKSHISLFAVLRIFDSG